MTNSVIVNATVIGCAISGLIMCYGIIRVIVSAIIDAKAAKQHKEEEEAT